MPASSTNGRRLSRTSGQRLSFSQFFFSVTQADLILCGDHLCGRRRSPKLLFRNALSASPPPGQRHSRHQNRSWLAVGLSEYPRHSTSADAEKGRISVPRRPWVKTSYFDFPQSRVPEEVFFLPVHPWLSVVFQFFFILLAAGPTLQNLIPHLPQFFDDPSLGFGGFLDNAEHRLNLGLQLGVFLQSFLQGRFAGNSTVLSKHSGEVCKGNPRSTRSFAQNLTRTSNCTQKGSLDGGAGTS